MRIRLEWALESAPLLTLVARGHAQSSRMPVVNERLLSTSVTGSIRASGSDAPQSL